MKFKVFPSFDKVEANTEAQVQVVVKGEGERRLLFFDKPVKALELSKLEALKIAFALLGRVGICENCGTPFRRKASTGLYVKARFCCRECYYEWCRKTGGTLGILRKQMEIKPTITQQDHVRWGREGGKRTQELHSHVRLNLVQYSEKKTAVNRR